MTDDLQLRIEAVAARVASGLGDMIAMPYPQAKRFIEGVLRAEVLPRDLPGSPSAGSNDLREELAAVINAAGREVDLNAVRALVAHLQPKLDRLAEYETTVRQIWDWFLQPHPAMTAEDLNGLSAILNTARAALDWPAREER